jgi:hypothetical protein
MVFYGTWVVQQVTSASTFVPSFWFYRPFFVTGLHYLLLITIVCNSDDQEKAAKAVKVRIGVYIFIAILICALRDRWFTHLFSRFFTTVLALNDWIMIPVVFQLFLSM